MKRLTVGPLTPAKRASRTDDSSPIVGGPVSSALATRRSDGDSSPTRWRIFSAMLTGTLATRPGCGGAGAGPSGEWPAGGLAMGYLIRYPLERIRSE